MIEASDTSLVADGVAVAGPSAPRLSCILHEGTLRRSQRSALISPAKTKTHPPSSVQHRLPRSPCSCMLDVVARGPPSRPVTPPRRHASTPGRLVCRPLASQVALRSWPTSSVQAISDRCLSRQHTALTRSGPVHTPSHRPHAVAALYRSRSAACPAARRRVLSLLALDLSPPLPLPLPVPRRAHNTLRFWPPAIGSAEEPRSS
jgi:hypothetical protein